MKQLADGTLRKSYPVFDCDAHVNDPLDIWDKYVEPEYRELVKQAYWRDERQALINGHIKVTGGSDAEFGWNWNPITISGPGLNKKLLRRLRDVPMTPEQRRYLRHEGAYDPRARLKDMDLMGIDQVLVIPTMLVDHFLFIENHHAANALARAYNNWVYDWCKTSPDRLYPAAILPVQNTVFAVQELHRVAKMGFRVALVRPIDAQGNYPNRIYMPPRPETLNTAFWDPIYRAFEETSIVLGIHTFPHPSGTASGPVARSPGEYVNNTSYGTGRWVNHQSLSFVFEAMTWTAQILLSGFLDRYPKLRMAIFESNCSWLPELLEHCDRLFKLYANERARPTETNAFVRDPMYKPPKRLPTEAFYSQALIAFEGDELDAFRQWERFQDIGIWSSDAYHSDGSGAWVAIRNMEELEVPESAQAMLMGANARRFYGIEGKTFVTDEPKAIPRPAWFPKQDEEFEKWWEKTANPRKYSVGPR